MDQFSFRVANNDVLVYRSIFAPVKSNMFTILSGKEAIVFDPHENQELLVLFHEKGIRQVHIMLTHGHYDHISGVLWLKDNTNAKVFCQERCAERLRNDKRPLARMVAMILAEEDKKDGGHRYQNFKSSYKPFTITADQTFDKNACLIIGAYKIKVTSTPGHSEGSACYELNGKLVFTGDTLLQYDPVILRFPGGDKDNYDKIALPYLQQLDKKMVVMPGHGNPFVLGMSNIL